MIELKHLSKRFATDFVVKDVSLTIKTGQIVGFLGPNGAGKTTTLRMIAGVLPSTKGKALINGQDINNQDGQVKAQIGYLPENNPLYEELTVEEYLKFWANLKNIPSQQQPAAIDFVVKHTGISSVYYRPISELSKGFRQRVGLSQAILTKPPILILDEPTEGLDPNQRREIASLIKSLGKKRTVIIASHVLGEIVKIANRIIIIHQGKIVGDDTPDNLRHLKAKTITIELEIRGSGVVSRLKKLKGVVSLKKEGVQTYLVNTRPHLDLRPDIFNLAKKQNWLLLTMYRKSLDLEDIFRQLTKQ